MIQNSKTSSLTLVFDVTEKSICALWFVCSEGSNKILLNRGLQKRKSRASTCSTTYNYATKIVPHHRKYYSSVSGKTNLSSVWTVETKASLKAAKSFTIAFISESSQPWTDAAQATLFSASSTFTRSSNDKSK